MRGMDAGQLTGDESLAEIASLFAAAILRRRARRRLAGEDAEFGPEKRIQEALSSGWKRGSVSTRVNGFESPKTRRT